jgi:hypothetical protein
MKTLSSIFILFIGFYAYGFNTEYLRVKPEVMNFVNKDVSSQTESVSLIIELNKRNGMKPPLARIKKQIGTSCIVQNILLMNNSYKYAEKRYLQDYEIKIVVDNKKSGRCLIEIVDAELKTTSVNLQVRSLSHWAD